MRHIDHTRYGADGGGIIGQIVGRCHVGQPYVEVLRYVVSRLKSGAWEKMPRADRRSVVATVVKEHNENRDLYRSVMGGVR